MLGLTASPFTGRAATAPAAGAVAVGLDVVTPVAAAHLQISAPGVAAEIATPQAGVKVSVERKKQKPAAAAQGKQRRTPAGSAATRSPEALPNGVRARAAPASSAPHASTAATEAAPGAPLPLEPGSGASSAPSFALEAASTAGGVSAALAGAVLVAFLLLSQVSRVPARTLRLPLLSLDLQRPG